MDNHLALTSLTEDVYNTLLSDFEPKQLNALGHVSKIFHKIVDKFYVYLANQGKDLSYFKGKGAVDFAVKHQLHTVKLFRASNEDFCKLSALFNLRVLEIGYCSNLCRDNLGSLCTLTNLQELALFNCIALTDTSDLQKLIKLVKLSLGNLKITHVKSFSTLTDLTNLNISCLSNVTDISGLSALIKLKRLSFSRCAELVNLSPLEKITGLKQLGISSCPKVTSIASLSALIELEELDLSDMEPNNIESLSTLTNLKELTIANYDKPAQITDVKSLGAAIKLQKLHLSRCKLIDLDYLSALTDLQEVSFACEAMARVEKITYLTNLQCLRLFGKFMLSSLEPSSAIHMGKLTKLNELNLSDFKLSDVTGLAALANLKQLTLLCELANEADFENMVKNGDYRLTSLQQLSQDRFSSPQGIEHMSKLSNLQGLMLDLYKGDKRSSMYFFDNK